MHVSSEREKNNMQKKYEHRTGIDIRNIFGHAPETRYDSFATVEIMVAKKVSRSFYDGQKYIST